MQRMNGNTKTFLFSERLNCLGHGIHDIQKADMPASAATEAPPAWGSVQGKYKSVKNKHRCADLP